MRLHRAGAALAALVLAVGASLAVSGDAGAHRPRAGTLGTASAPSPALGTPIDYTVYLPYGYDRSRDRYPVLYLLHGRGDTMQAWTQIKADLDKLIGDGDVPPVIAVMPDAPWSERGSWYVDSAYTGDDPGRPVETALTRDLIAHVDAAYRTSPQRNGRLIGGYSMGGAGALRYALAHQDLFANALVLSPAVYRPLPPADSETRNYGAFGTGAQLFSDDVYQRLNYPALLPAVNPEQPVRMYIAVGDDEWPNPDPADAAHDLDYEAATLYNTVRRTDGVSAEFRVLDGGHDWSVWRPAFADGLKQLAPTLSVVPPAGLPGPLYGGTATDWAGGVAAGADGSTTLAYAETGSGLDAVVTRPGSWTTRIASPANERLYGVVPLPDGGVISAGYTRGDLDGKHASMPADDAFVVRLGADGKQAWLTQAGDPAKADRFYAVAAAPDGGAYLAGYSSGSFGGATSAGDKDAILVRIGSDGRIIWIHQFGGSGEDKAYSVAADANGVYVAGVTSGAMPGTTSTGGTDGWLAAFGTDGTPKWLKAEGGTGDDLLGGVAVGSTGQVVASGKESGDVVTVAYSAAGRQLWRTITGGKGDDAGAEVVPLAGGAVEVVGYTRSALGVPAGAADVLTLRLDAKGRQTAVAQFGSVRDDAVDAFGEENVYATARPDGKLLVTGLTSGGVFLATVDPAKGTP